MATQDTWLITGTTNQVSDLSLWLPFANALLILKASLSHSIWRIIQVPVWYLCVLWCSFKPRQTSSLGLRVCTLKNVRIRVPPVRSRF